MTAVGVFRCECGREHPVSVGTISTMVSPNMTTEEVAVALGRSVRTVEGWRRKGKGPPFFAFGNIAFYPRSDFERWVALHTYRPRR